MFVTRQRIWLLFAVVVALGLVALSAARPTSGAGSETRYVVQPGDTLWALAAKRYGGDPRHAIWEIKERNDLRTSELRPGMVLALPP
jgi:nucleoid-associated protein YgaU